MKSSVKKGVLVLLLFVLFVAASARADEVESFSDMNVPSHVTFDVGTSSGGSSTLNLDADIGLESGNRIGVGVGGSQLKSSAQTLKTNSVRASFQTDPLEEWSFGLSGESWGAREKLVVNSAKVDVTWAPVEWEFSLDPEFRSINWFVESGTRRKYQSASYATHARISYYGISKTRLTLSGGNYSYSDNLETAFNSGLFFEEALDLASGFPKNYLGLDGSYNFGGWSLGLGVTSTRYEYDNTLSQTVFVRSNVELSKTWSLGAEVGSTTSEANRSSFGNLSATYSW